MSKPSVTFRFSDSQLWLGLFTRQGPRLIWKASGLGNLTVRFWLLFTCLPFAGGLVSWATVVDCELEKWECDWFWMMGIVWWVLCDGYCVMGVGWSSEQSVGVFCGGWEGWYVWRICLVCCYLDPLSYFSFLGQILNLKILSVKSKFGVPPSQLKPFKKQFLSNTHIWVFSSAINLNWLAVAISFSLFP